MISFNQIPTGLRTPGQYIEFDNTRALAGLPGQQHKILVIGQRLATGTVAEAVPKQVSSAALAEEYFGRGSMLSAMFAALKAANPHTASWGIALDDDGAGVAATGTITVTGPATEAGTIVLYIGGKRIKVAVANADADADIATAIAAAVNAQTDLPVTAAAVLAVVTLTARNKGEAANDIDIRENFYTGEKTPAGVALAVVGMSGGTTNPDIATVIAAIGDEHYNTIIMPFTDAANLIALEAELSTRWGPLKMIEGHAFAAAAGTHAAMITLGDGRNSQFVTIMATGGAPGNPWEWAAVLGGIDAAEPDPARPRQTLELPGLLAPAETARYTREERDLLLNDGISTFTVDAGGLVRIERLITTYQTNAQAVPDVSYLNVTTMRTLAYLRFSQRARIALKFPRHKLADDGTTVSPGQAIVTPETIKMELIALYQDWMDAGLVENLALFKSALVVERDGDDPDRLNAQLPPDIMNQLRVFAAQIQFRL